MGGERRSIRPSNLCIAASMPKRDYLEVVSNCQISPYEDTVLYARGVLIQYSR